MSKLKKDKQEPKKTSRRDFFVMSATTLASVGAACTVVPLIDSLNPDQSTLAVGSTEVDLSGIPEGNSIKVQWRGKPVFVTKRTAGEIKAARDVKLSELKDPQLDSDRVKSGHEQWLVTIGICTHLGCIPLVNKGDFNGWFCPCHGSHYDTSGRVRKGPAPRNLDIPSYEFLDENTIRIG
jgi:ubiquinol-cytochrome c reductase iron-sulfur subunit